jgi:DNA-binding MarR family transcriptional regulator
VSTTPDSDEVVIPALLRAARGTYARAIRSRLAAAGCDDVPRDGAYVLGGMANHGGSAGDLIREMGITKQAASQLIDTLVLRGYLERQVNPEDRRRMTIDVTERGRAAATAIRAGIVAVDAELAELVSPAELAGFRAGLVALIDIRERWEDQDLAPRPSP